MRSLLYGQTKNIKELKKEVHSVIEQEIKKNEQSAKVLSIVSLFLILGYLYIIFYFTNIGVTTVAIILMLTRIPDLLLEIKTGESTLFIFRRERFLQKMGYEVKKSKSRVFIEFITNFLYWVSLPFLYYFLFIY